MKLFKKAIACIGILSMLATTSAMAATFTDMPEGEVGLAIENAVNNGLIGGYDDNTVRPNGNITRAEMAAIITRAFGVVDNAKATFGDVADNAWYKDVVEKAVYMGAFQGDDKGNFNPEKNITFQETYTVLARVFQYIPRDVTVDGKKTTVPVLNDGALDKFEDASSVADWAKNYALAIVDRGGYTGFDGKLKPTDYITRGEFAMVMDELVSLYIDEAGTYTDGFGNGAVVVRCGDVTIDGLKTSKNVIVGYGAEKPVTIKNVESSASIVVLGGRDRTPVVKEVDGKKVSEPDDKLIDIHGKLYDVRILSPQTLAGIKWTNPANEVFIHVEDASSVIDFGISGELE
ncbi:MAG: S-layer homology domain-containing protein [Clostridia bacterium]|nr:S-layer homology domain-containing protein [Clostridia bacterium]